MSPVAAVEKDEQKGIRTPGLVTLCLHIHFFQMFPTVLTIDSTTRSAPSCFLLKIQGTCEYFTKGCRTENSGQDRLSALLPALKDELPLTMIVLCEWGFVLK